MGLSWVLKAPSWCVCGPAASFQHRPRGFPRPLALWALEAEHVCVLLVGPAGCCLVRPLTALPGLQPAGAAGERERVAGASSACCPSCGPCPVGGARVVSPQTCALQVTAPASPAGRAPCTGPGFCPGTTSRLHDRRGTAVSGPSTQMSPPQMGLSDHPLLAGLRG